MLRRRRLSIFPSHPLAGFVLRRLVALFALLLGISLIAFALTNVAPADPVTANLSPNQLSNPDAVRVFRERYNLDDPLPVQYLTYVWNALHGDLGTSIQTETPVADELGRLIPATAELALFAMLFAICVGIPLGVIAAMRYGRSTDHAVRVVSLLGISMPSFWLALIAIYVVFFKLGWLPGNGRLDPGATPPPSITRFYTVDALVTGRWDVLWDALQHLILPAIVVASASVGFITRYTRSAVLEVLGEDYVRAARAKGLPESTVVRRHVLRAALVSIVTIIGLLFAQVLTGAVLVETIFSWPGLGQYAYTSSTRLDLPAIMGTSMFVAAVYVTVNFIADLLYGVIDPRMRIA